MAIVRGSNPEKRLDLFATVVAHSHSNAHRSAKKQKKRGLTALSAPISNFLFASQLPPVPIPNRPRCSNVLYCTVSVAVQPIAGFTAGGWWRRQHTRHGSRGAKGAGRKVRLVT